MKIFIHGLFVLFPLLSISQKVEIKDTLITKDGIPYCKIFKQHCILGACDYSIHTLDGKEVLFIRLAEYTDAATKSASNKTGRVVYLEWIFLDSESKAETRYINNKKSIARLIVEYDLLSPSDINEESERKFILIQGTPYSGRNQQFDGKVIIIKD